jgi:hypothetical protein
MVVTKHILVELCFRLFSLSVPDHVLPEIVLRDEFFVALCAGHDPWAVRCLVVLERYDVGEGL